MKILVRGIVGSFVAHALTIGVVGTGFLLGVGFLSHPPDDGLSWTHVADELVDLLPLVAGPFLFLAGMVSFGQFHAEGSLLSLANSGMSLRRPGGWVLVASLPVVLSVGWLSAWGPPEPVLPPLTSPAQLVGGGLLMFSGEADDHRAPASALLPAEGRLLVGVHRPSPPQSPPQQVRLRVHTEWQLLEDGVERTEPAPYLWFGDRLAAPRTLLWGRDAPAPGLETVTRWLEQEPWRDDLRFTRLALARPALRVLVLLVLGLAFWLRPVPYGFRRRCVVATLLGGAYLGAELLCGGLGVTGSLPAAAGAFGPAACFGAAGARLWWTCDRPRA